MLVYLFLVTCAEIINKSYESNPLQVDLSLQFNKKQTIPIANPDEQTLPFKKRKLSCNIPNSNNVSASTQSCRLKSVIAHTKDYSITSPKRVCENTKIQNEKSNHDKNIKKKETIKTEWESVLEKLQVQIGNWDLEDKQIKLHVMKLICDGSSKILKRYLKNRHVITDIFFRFKYELFVNLDKINNVINNFPDKRKSKKSLCVQFNLFKLCIDYINDMLPNQQRYKYTSHILMSIYVKLYERLEILDKQYKIITKFDIFALNFKRGCGYKLAFDETYALRLIRKRLKFIFGRLKRIGYYCSAIISDLQILRNQYGIKLN